MKKNEKEILSLLRFARAFCCERLAWFSPAIFRCKIHLTKQIEIAAIDYSFNIYFNPDAVEVIEESGTKKEVLAQLGFLWIHEISHILREHGDRAKSRNANPSLWNIAADMEINDSTWQGLIAPKKFPGVYPHTFNLEKGKLAEYYYSKITDKKNSQLQELINTFQQNLGEYKLDEGSGVHGVSRPWEVDSDTQKIDPVELELIRREVAQEIKKVGYGSISAGWVRWANEKLKPKIDWKKVLRHKMSVAINIGVGSRIDYSFFRPSRRQAIYEPVITPSLRGDTSARIVVVIDTSGSMSSTDLSQALAEVFEILRTFQFPVTIIPCDAKAFEPINVHSTSDLFKVQKLKGGGGTNMIVGIEAALKTDPAPDSILILTDGETPYPPKPYKTPVIFGIIHRGESQNLQKPPIPPWKNESVIEINLNS